METQIYFENLRKEVDKVYEMAGEARAKGLDPVDEVEIPLAMSMAEKVVGLISTIYPQMKGSGISKRILELEKEYGKLDSTIVFKIAEEVARQKFCTFENLIEAIDAGIRVGFAYITLAVVSSPIEGFTGLKVRKTRNNKDYLEASFSGPIRSAGTTASCLVLILIDYLRELFGFAKYDPTEEEIKRTYVELSHFHERITNLQYMPAEEEAIFLARNLPIQISGEPSEKIEAPNYKNLERVDTNFLRSGFCLIIGEGLAQKAAKGFRLLNNAKKNGIKSSGFDWLEEYVELHEKKSIKASKKGEISVYLKDLVAGRPVYGHPGRSGGFRFRYGRSRVSGFSSASVHPATMAITDNFIAIGTQLKIERPTKGCVVTSCDQIDGPIVKLFNGSVKKLRTTKEAEKFYKDVEEIIYLGDILLPFSDVVNRNSELIKPGYVEEWWNLELLEKDSNFEIDCLNVDFDKAVELSNLYEVPLHPNYIFYWTQISREEFKGLISWLNNSWIHEKIIFPYNKSEQEKFAVGKRALEILGIEHEVSIENVVLTKESSKALLANLGIDYNFADKNEKIFLKEFLSQNGFNELSELIEVLEIINKVSKFIIKDKAGEFIGTRMGRPEKAKLRKLIGSPNALFPVGKAGGRLRSVQEACEVGRVRSSFPIYFCEKCQKEIIYPKCEVCETKTKKKYFYFKDGEKSFDPSKDGLKGAQYVNQDLDISSYFDDAVRKLSLEKGEIPHLIKGVRGTSSKNHFVENLAKGILRAKYNLQVNKDGTIRMDATELPLVCFKPKEILVTIEKLLELGYDKDIYGTPLKNEDQILELMPHDIVLPCCNNSSDEKADEVFFRIAKFVDEELEKFYKLGKFYNLKSKKDLAGQIGVCMAPHNCAGVVCRFIGFSNTQGLLASPYMHAAIRRDCDGDEASIMLLGDVLLNFSKEFLPAHRGGTQDAPLVLNAKIDAGEVDDQILDFEVLGKKKSYPLELYKKAEKNLHSSEVLEIENIKKVLKKDKDPFRDLGFTHDTNNLNEGVSCSSYKILATMQEKVQHQMELIEKLRSTDASDVARMIIERHFIRDMRGNLRGFSSQEFRCVKCNEIVRRPPLKGVCPVCNGKLIFTINEGGIKKYLEPALNLAEKYNLSPYLKQSLELIKRYIDSIFGKELEKQEKIEKWF
ncbi:DNA polymerase II large subunit [Candidatus Woesearchaeota archaeon]|nr:DNA polymerase II large subunit [Candidatus Woesearchaeota archaeon]